MTAISALLGKAAAPALAVLLVGVGGAAAAGLSTQETPDPDGTPTLTAPPTTDAATPEPPTTELPATQDPTDPPVDPAPPTEQPDTSPGTPEDSNAPESTPIACEDATSHGEYVSSIARSTPGGPGKGAIVSEAARSDCGKTDTRGTKDDADDPDDTDSEDEPRADREKSPGQKKGKSSAPGPRSDNR